MYKMNAYLFVTAAIIAVVSVLVILKVNIRKLIDNPKQFPVVQKHFFIGVGVSKIIPVVLLILGIVKLSPVEDISDLYIPWLLIIITVGLGLSYISSQKNLDVDEDRKIAIHTLTTIARPLLFSLPLTAALFLFLMTR